jgi:C4-dicarboxylate-specific signal transduction histidine kinase
MTPFRQTEIAFFGRITAGVTHELKNVLAIVNESSGLMQDLMALSKETPAYHDRFTKALTSIKAQVQRGQSLIARLNQFAHAPDIAVRSIDLFETAGLVVALSQRYAALKNVALEIVPPSPSEQAVQATINLVQFQMAVYTAIECWLSLAAPGNKLSLYLSRKENTCAVLLANEGDFPAATDPAGSLAAAEKWPLLQCISAALGGTVAIDARKPGVLLILPVNAPAE